MQSFGCKIFSHLFLQRLATNYSINGVYASSIRLGQMNIVIDVGAVPSMAGFLYMMQYMPQNISYIHYNAFRSTKLLIHNTVQCLDNNGDEVHFNHFLPEKPSGLIYFHKPFLGQHIVMFI